MSLRWRTLLLLSIMTLVLAGTTYAVQRWVIVPGFAETEVAEARDDLARCVEGLARDAQHFSASAHDWAAWDDMHRYVVDRNEAFATANMIPETFNNNHINLLAILNVDGRRIWGEIRDEETTGPIEVPGFWEALCRPDHPLVRHATPDAVVEGVLMTAQGAMLIGSRPIITSKNEGPIRGALIMGRLIDREFSDELAHRTRVRLELRPIDDPALSAEDRAALIQLGSAPRDANWMQSTGSKVLHGYRIIRDVFDRPALLLHAELPRTISGRGMHAARVATACSMAGGIVVIAVTWLLLQRGVIRPLLRLTNHAVKVGHEDNLHLRLNLTRTDEIGALAGEFDRMVGRLAEARARMLAGAHEAGMAQVAVEMLHNVGNLLNSVNVSVGVVKNKLTTSEVKTVGQAAQLMLERGDRLAEFLTTDERGRRIPGFLAELSTVLSGEHEQMIGEMNRVGASLDHIQQIIDGQNDRSGRAGVLETVDAAALVEEAIWLSAEAFARHDVELARDFEPVGLVSVNRNKVLQILTNLLSNAKRAVVEGGRIPRRVTVRLRRDAAADRPDAAPRIAIQVVDNGAGIAAEHLPQLFSFGFSTKPNSRGCGLHSAVNMARELGGDLAASSDGPGCGACFTLTLPTAEVQVNA